MFLTRAKPPEPPKTKHVRYHFLGPCSEKMEESLRAVVDIAWPVIDKVNGVDTVLVMIQEPVYALAVKLVSPKTPVAPYIHYPFEEEATREKPAKIL